VKWDLMNPEMVIIGTADGAATGDVERLTEVYRPLLRNDPRIVVGTWDEAESIKIFYNTFISAKLSLVNMIQDVAERVGNIDVDVVSGALKHSTHRITGPAYMRSGMGDGGACHPRDNIALRWLAQELDLGYDLFGAVMLSRERQAANLAARMAGLADRHALKETWIHGKTYKPRVPYTSGSYSLLVAHHLERMGRRARFIDPLTGDSRDRVHGVVLLAHEPQADHPAASCESRRGFYCAFEPGSVILDPWRRVEPGLFPGCVVVHYGNTRLRQSSPASVSGGSS
jgi:UDPglucose 6-dehydrogenase